ncbi:MAG: hypothetical protein WC344_04740 [Bacilli bacterium]
MEIFFTLLSSVLLTLVIEAPIYFFFNRKSLIYLLAVYAMNIVLNLAMNALLIFVFTNDYSLSLTIMEIIIIIIEGFILFWFENIRYKGFIIALGANLASLGIGLAINHLWPVTSVYFAIPIIVIGLFVIESTIILLAAFENTKTKIQN